MPLAILLLCTLAGCADRPPAPADEPRQDAPTASPSAGLALRADGWLNETFTIVQSGVGPNQVEGSNCIHFAADELRQVRSGWVNVSWTTPNVAAQEMRLVASGEGPLLEARGPSPLRLELDDLRPHPQVDLVIYLRTAGLAGADVQVDMRMRWEFTYEGAASLTVLEFTCG